jgi:hypothetical protein
MTATTPAFPRPQHHRHLLNSISQKLAAQILKISVPPPTPRCQYRESVCFLAYELEDQRQALDAEVPLSQQLAERGDEHPLHDEVQPYMIFGAPGNWLSRRSSWVGLCWCRGRCLGRGRCDFAVE